MQFEINKLNGKRKKIIPKWLFLFLIIYFFLSTSNAVACMVCVNEMLWLIFPYYWSWLLIFFIWGIIVLIMRIYYRTLSKKDIRNILIALGIIIVSIMFTLPYPFVLLAFFILWLRSYKNTYLRIKQNKNLIHDRAYLFINHLTVLFLLVSAIYFQTRYIVGGQVYRLYHVGNGSPGRALVEKMIKQNLLSKTELIQLLKQGNNQAKINAGVILLKKDYVDIEVMDLIINELPKMDKKWVNYRLAFVIQEYFGLNYKIDETFSTTFWLNWWKNNRGSFEYIKKQKQQKSD